MKRQLDPGVAAEELGQGLGQDADAKADARADPERAREFGHEGITANVLAPGLTLPRAAREALPQELRDGQIALRSIKREERPEDLVGTAFFLASPDADFLTGQAIVVDGGNTML